MKATRTHCGVDSLAPVYTKAEDAGAAFLPFFKKNFSISIVEESPEAIVFDMVGIDAPLANAFRRILLAEVPSVAIEHVFITKNTSIIQDEVLAHRLGLIPLRVDPRQIEMIERGDDSTDLNTLVFKLSARGVPRPRDEAAARREGASGSEEDIAASPYTAVHAREIYWEPQGGQLERFAEPAAPVHGDILVAKLAAGQEIDVEMHAVKGVGKDHAKFSPVATAAYRLLPVITIDKEFKDAEADQLVKACPVGVFDIEELAGGHRRARVAKPRNCTVCRECIRDPAWAERIRVERDNSHFIFSVESTGCLDAKTIFREAVTILADKAKSLLSTLDASATSGSGSAAAAAAASPFGGLPHMSASKAAAYTSAVMRSPDGE